MASPEEVNELLREMAGQSVLLSETIAGRVGLSPADLEVLGEIEHRGPLTAGALGELTGLSPAAVTALIDRLERARVVRRRADREDRRRVLVETARGARRVAELYGPLEVDALAVMARRSDAEREVIADFLRDMLELGVDHVARLERPGRRRKRR